MIVIVLFKAISWHVQKRLRIVSGDGFRVLTSSFLPCPCPCLNPVLWFSVFFEYVLLICFKYGHVSASWWCWRISWIPFQIPRPFLFALLPSFLPAFIPIGSCLLNYFGYYFPFSSFGSCSLSFFAFLIPSLIILSLLRMGPSLRCSPNTKPILIAPKSPKRNSWRWSPRQPRRPSWWKRRTWRSERLWISSPRRLWVPRILR